MSLNSRNRFSNLSAEVTESRYLAEQKEEAEQTVFEESCAYLDENAEAPNSYSNLLEASMVIGENDLKVFNSSIELEFVSAMNESVGILTESAQGKLTNKRSSKIKDQISKIAEFSKNNIKSAGTAFNDTSLGIHKRDKNVYEKYMEAILGKRLDGYRGTSNFLFPTKESANAIDKIIDPTSIKSITNTVTDKIKNSISEYGVNEAVEDYDLCMQKINNDISDSIRKAISVSETWVPDDIDIAIMEAYVNNPSNITKSISNASYTVSRAIDEITNKILETVDSLGSEPESNIKAIGLYNIESATCRTLMENFNSYIDMEIREVASYRAGIINCGKYAIKSSKGIRESYDEQSINESAVIESSNLYVFDCFDLY